MRSGKEGTGGARTRRLGVLRIAMEGTEHGKVRSGLERQARRRSERRGGE